MNHSTEQLVRWAAVSWLWVFAVLVGFAAGELVKKWPAPTGWDAPSQLARQEPLNLYCPLVVCVGSVLSNSFAVLGNAGESDQLRAHAHAQDSVDLMNCT